MDLTTGSVMRSTVEGVAVVSFDRPDKHNALSDAMSEAWRSAMEAAIDDDEIGCILLRGEGPSFCSGRDTGQLGHRVAGESDLSFVRRAQQVRLATLASPKPVVAAVQGYALGGGFEIALSADMRIAASDALFGFPEIRFGLVPDTGGTQLLTPLIGPSKAKYLILSGERVDAATALSWGIVDWVVAPSDLEAAALDLARQLAGAPRQAAAMTKQLVDQAWAGSIRRGFGEELVAQVALFGGDEHRRAKAAYVGQLAARGS